MIAANKVKLFVCVGLLCFTEVWAQDTVRREPIPRLQLIDTLRIRDTEKKERTGYGAIPSHSLLSPRSDSQSLALYDFHGTLIANQDVKLSASELILWNKIKDSLIVIAYRKLSYHPLFVENEIQFKVIFEVVFKPEKPANYRIYQSSIELNNNQSNILLGANSNMFHSWDALFKKTVKTDDVVKFYLPVRYIVPKTTAIHHYAPAADSVYINNGWMFLHAGIVVERSKR